MMNYITSRSEVAAITALFKFKGWLLKDDETVQSISIPGEGNMNVVLRVKTNHRSVILKQSRPYVEKYPDIPAPLERIKTEYQFYNAMKDATISNNLPKVIAYDAEDHLILMEDLGAVSDLMSIYEEREITTERIQLLMEVLMVVHQSQVPTSYPSNLELRKLNHQHIFILPFMVDNGFQLDDVQDGLQELSIGYKQDDELKTVVDSIGEKYLSAGDTMLHGDYYPGSWMKVEDEIYVLDPEFSFAGFAEFDLGVMIGHLILATGDINVSQLVMSHYSIVHDPQLVKQIAGIEIMRRLIGLAQLPLIRTIAEKKELLQSAYAMIMA